MTVPGMTQGPWHANTPADERYAGGSTIREATQGEVIATVARTMDGYAIGNARAIAAVPDLLAALEAMLDAQSRRRHPLGAPDEGIATICVEAASKARAALAKARGEEGGNGA